MNNLNYKDVPTRYFYSLTLEPDLFYSKSQWRWTVADRLHHLSSRHFSHVVESGREETSKRAHKAAQKEISRLLKAIHDEKKQGGIFNYPPQRKVS